MAIDLMALRKMAAEKARRGGKPPAVTPAAAEPDADDAAGKAPEGKAPVVNPFVAAAAKAKERLRK